MVSTAFETELQLCVDRPRRNRLSIVLDRLRELQPFLAERSVAHVWVFGSVARSEDHEDSDVDLLVEFDPNARISLTAVARLRIDLSELLDWKVDLAEWRTLRPEIVTAVRTDAVEAF